LIDSIAAPGIEEVREKVWNLVKGKILIGHGIFDDELEKLLKRVPPASELRIRDTAAFYKFTGGLRGLTRKVLNLQLRNGKEGRSSVSSSIFYCNH